MSIESVVLSSHLILCHPLLLLSSLFPSIRVFSNELALRIRWPKYGSLSFSISSSNEESGLISFRIDWFDLPAVQGTLQGSSAAPQLESINFSVLSLLYGLTFTALHDYWKNRSFDYMDLFVSQVINVSALSRFIIAFFSRSKHLSWLQSPSTVIWEPKKIKSVTASTFPPSICYELMGRNAMILIF